MAYTKPQYQGIDRFLNQVAESPTEQNEGYLVHGGYRVGGGGRSLPQGISKLLMSKKNEEDAANYGTEQQNALMSGDLATAAGNAAQAGDMKTAIELASAAENAKQRNAALGLERLKLTAEQSKKLAEEKKKSEADALARSSAIGALKSLKELGESGDINVFIS